MIFSEQNNNNKKKNTIRKLFSKIFCTFFLTKSYHSTANSIYFLTINVIFEKGVVYILKTAQTFRKLVQNFK